MADFKAGDVVTYSKEQGIAIVEAVSDDGAFLELQAWAASERNAFNGRWCTGTGGLYASGCALHPDPDKILAAYTAHILLRGVNENA